MKNNILRRRRGISLAIMTLVCALLLGGMTQAPAKDKNNKNGYWDPHGNYHYYSDDRKSQDGYWDPHGNYHRYSDNQNNQNNQGSDYISTGKRIWDIFH